MELIKKSSSDTPSKENKKMKHCMGGMDMKWPNENSLCLIN
jgi:hypothetical protein